MRNRRPHARGRLIRTVALVGAVCIVSLACTRRSANEQEPSRLPTQVIESFVTTSREKGTTAWELRARTARVFEDEQETELEHPRLLLFRVRAGQTAVRAEHGVYLREHNRIELWGKVRVDESAKQITLQTERMFYDTKTERLFSDEPVTLTRPGTVVHGTGFESDSGFETVRIEHSETETNATGVPR